MQRIEVQNFGPLKNVTLEIKDYMIFIGPQASGKSTLAKLVHLYFNFTYRISRQYNIGLFQRAGAYTNHRDVLRFYDLNTAENDFINYSYVKSDTKIVFYYDDNTYIDLINEIPSANLDKMLSDIFEEYKRVRALRFSENIGFEESDAIRSNFHIDTMAALSSVTNIQSNVYSIPAGRMSAFQEKAETRYDRFLYFVIEDLFDRGIYMQENTLFEDLKSQILKGKLSIRLGKNKKTLLDEYIPIISGENFETAIQQASSGQQEAAGIILIIEYLIRQRNANCTIIEEPEAHLFPEAQRDLTYLISLLANQPNNQVLLTTHSPYILAALNNLMKAYTVGQAPKNESTVHAIIPKELWINPEQVFVGYIEQGKIKNIIDPELQQIEHECLDNVSIEIMESFDQLLDVQYS